MPDLLISRFDWLRFDHFFKVLSWNNLFVCGSSLCSLSGSGLSLFGSGSLCGDSLEGIFGTGFVGSGSWVVDGGSVVRSRLVVDGSGVVRSRGRFVYGSGFVVDGSRGRLIDGFWGRFVCGSWVGFVCWGGVGSGLVGSSFGVGCFTFVFNISNVTLGSSSVGNNLDTTIGKVDTVFSSGVIVVTALLLAENWSVSGIIYSIFVVVHWG